MNGAITYKYISDIINNCDKNRTEWLELESQHSYIYDGDVRVSFCVSPKRYPIKYDDFVKCIPMGNISTTHVYIKFNGSIIEEFVMIIVDDKVLLPQAFINRKDGSVFFTEKEMSMAKLFTDNDEVIEQYVAEVKKYALERI